MGRFSTSDGSVGLRPCWARYRSTDFMRFWGGGVRCCDRSSCSSHGNEEDVWRQKRDRRVGGELELVDVGFLFVLVWLVCEWCGGGYE